jgi:selenium metabolism protein YedF
MKVVDARGMQCPRPIIETKKALRETQPGDEIKVLIDNETSLGNVCKFLKDNGCYFSESKQEGHWTLVVSASATPIADNPVDEYCEVPATNAPKGNYVVALTSEYMGQGDDRLGGRLMTSFVNILTELDRTPSAVLCYNSGVKLALPTSSVVETLKELEKRGVEVILCGTCVDFFDLKGKTVAGSIGDMYRIAGIMAAAGSVIKP